MLDSLSGRLEAVFRKLRGYGKLSEDNIREALREVRVALLEADVNLTVTKDFIEKIRERAVGQNVLKSLTPGQQVVKIVRDELVKLLGEKEEKLVRAPKSPTIIMMVGLQGSGKTTTAGKIARKLVKEGHNPLLIAADVYRPAAQDQLVILGKSLKVPVFDGEGSKDPLKICTEGLKLAKAEGYRTVILDTAGRLHIDDKMMEELKSIKEALNPHEILLVADAMTGQDAVNMAQSFNEQISLTGVALTKMDGDTRGGAVLSIKASTQVPVKFIGIGEKLDQLESFHPDRMASRILGMGDILSLVEKAEEAFDKEEAMALEKKIRGNSFTLEDFKNQMKQIKKMGSLEQLAGMLPGMNKLKGDSSIDEKELVRVEAIINSMTKKERLNPSIINGSRKKRIARGSGNEVKDVNRLLKQFSQSMKMMKQFSKPGFRQKMGMLGKGGLPF